MQAVLWVKVVALNSARFRSEKSVWIRVDNRIVKNDRTRSGSVLIGKTLPKVA